MKGRFISLLERLLVQLRQEHLRPDQPPAAGSNPAPAADSSPSSTDAAVPIGDQATGDETGAKDPVEDAAAPAAAAAPSIVIDEELVARSWDRWLVRAGLWLDDRSAPPEPADYGDVLFAALNLPPGNLFRADIGRMTPAEWNALAVAAMSSPDWKGRSWALALALRQLGFDARVLRPLMDPGSARPEEQALIERLVAEARTQRPGLLVIEEQPRLVELVAGRGPHALLVVGAASLPQVSTAIRFLLGTEAFAGIVEENDAFSKLAGSGDLPSIDVTKVARNPTGEPYKPDEISERVEQAHKEM